MRSMFILFITLTVATGCTSIDPLRHKLAFRDYLPTDPGQGALSLGVNTWTDANTSMSEGLYGDFKFLMLWHERLNIGIGAVSKVDDFEIRIHTSVTTHVFDCVEVGAYYAPFWGAAGNDDPFGFLLGYYFKFK